ncbi:MAG: peptidoglycan-associated lipoprotein Pal [Thermodesulfobacteriota bacterium]
MKKEFVRFCAVASSLVALSLFAGGCSKQVKSDKDMAGAGRGVGQEESLSSKGWAGGDLGKVLEGRTTAPMLPVYFDFDKSDIRADMQGRLTKNAELLNASSSVRVRVEGNTDERGTNEYNMALGERRAISAQKYLINSGVAASRIDVLSYGEEKPLELGHDEAAWAKNRRADFVVVQ